LANFPIRVFVVDDYKAFRRFAASVLGQLPVLQIVGEVSDGLEAVRKAGELQPNLILLDIGLPTLNGIDAARQIREHSPNSKILFFSEIRSLDIVERALGTGAVGYILKSDAARDLLAAVEAVLEGKQFVSSSLHDQHVSRHTDEHTGRRASREKIAPLPPHNKETRGQHEVVFYSEDRQLLDEVSQFIGAALKAGNAAVVVATGSHQDCLGRRLQAYGVDLAAVTEQGRYIALDPADALSTFMVDGMLDPVRFLESLGKVIVKTAEAANAVNGEHRRVAFFGEGADLLCQQGQAEAAIQDEKLRNELTKRYDVDILCAYSLSNLEGAMDEEVFQQIFAEHSTVISAGDAIMISFVPNSPSILQPVPYRFE